MMKLSKKTKIAGLVIFLMVLVANIAVISYFIFHQEVPTVNLEKAMAQYEAGNYQEAKSLFKLIIAQDPVNEMAFVYLAKIAQKEKNQAHEAYFWQMAVKLNPLREEYRDNALNALANIRNFKDLQELIAPNGQKPRKVLKDQESFLYLLAAYRLGKAPQAEPYLENLQKQKADFLNTPRGTFIQALYAIPPDQKTINQFAEVTDDDILATEAMLAKAEWLIAQRKPQELEKLLTRLAEMNPFCGRPRLAGFHMQECRFNKALDILEQDFKDSQRLSSALLMAECWFIKNDKEKLKDFQTNFKLSGKDAVIAGKYLDILVAMMDKNDQVLLDNWPDIKHEINTQLANLIGIYVAIKQNDLRDIEQRWNAILAKPPFYDFPKRARDMISGYASILIARQKPQEAARLLHLRKIDPMQSLLFARCYVSDRMDRKRLTQDDIVAALERYPQDLFLLQCAAEFYFNNKHYKKSLLCVNTAIKNNPPPNAGVYYLRIHNHLKLKQVDNAAAYYLELMQNLKENVPLLVEFCQFCQRYNRPDDLEKLIELMKRDSKQRALLIPLVKAHLLLLQGKTRQAMEQLGEVMSDNPLVIFKTAFLLGQHDRLTEALTQYEKLRKNHPDFSPVNTLVNMAEIYAAEGNLTKAREKALEAWKLDENSDIALFVLAKITNQAGNFPETIKLVPQSRLKDNKQLIRQWSIAAEHVFQDLLNQNQKPAAYKLAQDYEFWNPNTPKAKQLLKQARPAKEHTEND